MRGNVTHGIFRLALGDVQLSPADLDLQLAWSMVDSSQHEQEADANIAIRAVAAAVSVAR